MAEAHHLQARTAADDLTRMLDASYRADRRLRARALTMALAAELGRAVQDCPCEDRAALHQEVVDWCGSSVALLARLGLGTDGDE